jgi:hypothetical protein
MSTGKKIEDYLESYLDSNLMLHHVIFVQI